MGAGEGVIGFLLDLLPVAVPPCHTALVGAEVFYFPAHRLNYNLTTVPARLATVELWMAANMGADGTGWNAQCQRDFGAALSLLEHLVDNFDILFFHGYIPPFEFASSFIRLPPAIRPIVVEIHPGPGAYSPGNLCEFTHEAPCRCPQGKAPKMRRALPPGQKGQNGQISLPTEWDWSETPRRGVCRHPVLAP